MEFTAKGVPEFNPLIARVAERLRARYRNFQYVKPFNASQIKVMSSVTNVKTSHARNCSPLLVSRFLHHTTQRFITY